MMKQQNQKSPNGHRQSEETQTDQVRSGQTQSTIQQSKQMVGEYPISSMMVVFGLGIGLGVLLGQTLVGPVFQPERTMSERLGTQIYDAIANAIPDSLMRRLPG